MLNAYIKPDNKLYSSQKAAYDIEGLLFKRCIRKGYLVISHYITLWVGCFCFFRMLLLHFAICKMVTLILKSLKYPAL